MSEKTGRYTAGPKPVERFARQLQLGGYTFVQEHRFHAVRRWRFDFACLDFRVALEINGGNWISGRHTRPAALRSEYEKLNTAQLAGWLVLLVTPEQVNSGQALGLWEQALECRKDSQKTASSRDVRIANNRIRKEKS